MKLFKWLTSNKHQDPEVNSEKEIQKDDGFEKVLLTTDVFKSSLGKTIPETDKFYLRNLFVSEGRYFKENQIIATLASAIHGSGILSVRLPFSGKIEKIHLKPDHKIPFNDVLFSVSRDSDIDSVNQKIIEQNRQTLEQTEVFYLEDEFTDDKTIKVVKVGAEETPYFKLYENETELSHNFLGLTFTNHNGHVYMSLHSRNEHITLSKGDSVIFLFEDKSKINLTFPNAGNGTKGFRDNYSSIEYDELETFLKKRLIKAKLISARKNLYSIYSMNHRIYENTYLPIEQRAQYSIEIEGQYLLQLLTARFIEMNQNYKTG